jgi:hypothetical protein
MNKEQMDLLIELVALASSEGWSIQYGESYSEFEFHNEQLDTSIENGHLSQEEYEEMREQFREVFESLVEIVK